MSDVIKQQQFLTTTNAEDILSSVDLYLSSVGLRWDHRWCIVITSNGAASMTGKNLVLRRILNATLKHCFLHREALAAKEMVPVIHKTLKDVIQLLNYIEWSAENTRCFVSFRGTLAFAGKGTAPFL